MTEVKRDVLGKMRLGIITAAGACLVAIMHVAEGLRIVVE